MIEKSIQDFVNEVADNSMVDIYMLANKYFGTNKMNTTQKKLVVPSLSKIPSFKRSAVQSIVLEKTNYNIAPAKDLLFENIITLFRR